MSALATCSRAWLCKPFEVNDPFPSHDREGVVTGFLSHLLRDYAPGE
jgi:hypothetical protein